MKNFSTRISPDLDLTLTLYAIHLRCTKGEAGARAMKDGVPSWVMALSPSEAMAMDHANRADRLDATTEVLSQAFAPPPMEKADV